MGCYVLTSMFHASIPSDTAAGLRRLILLPCRFAFIASEFLHGHDRTDRYFVHFRRLLEEAGIRFADSYVIDGRMTPQTAREAAACADVLWLSGGNTPRAFACLLEYGLDEVIRRHPGVIIGMSAGSINLARTAVCSLTCGHSRQEIYPGLGCVDITVEPHFKPDAVSEELLTLSRRIPLTGLCDEASIIVENGVPAYCGDVFSIVDGHVSRLHSSADNP